MIISLLSLSILCQEPQWIKKSESHFNQLRIEQFIPTSPEALSPKALVPFQLKRDRSLYYVQASKQLEIEALEKDNGLKIRSSGRYNFRQKNLITEDINERSRFNLQTGVSWELLKDGVRDSKAKQAIAEIELQSFKLLSPKLQARNDYALRYNSIIYGFNAQALHYLEIQKQFLHRQLGLYRELYEYNLLNYQRIIEVSSKQEEVRSIISQIQSYNEAYAVDTLVHLGHRNWNVFDLKLEELLAAYDRFSHFDSLESLEKDRFSYLSELERDTRFNISGGLNMTQFGQNGNKLLYPSIQFQYSIPLKRDEGIREDMMTLSFQKWRADALLIRENERKEIMNHFFEFQQKLKLYKNFHYALHLLHEKLLTATILKDEALQTTISSYEIANEIMDTYWGFLDIQRQMYLIALKIFTYLPPESLFTLLHPIKINKIRQANMIIMLESQTLIEDAPFIIAYLKRKNYIKIIIKDFQSSFAKQARRICEQENIEIAKGLGEGIIIDVANFKSKRTLMAHMAKHPEENYILIGLKQLIEMDRQTLVK